MRLRARLNPDWGCFLQINPSTDIFLGRPAAQILAVIASLDYGGRSVCALLLFSSSKTVQILKMCSNHLVWNQGHPLGMGWQGFSNLASQGGFSFQMCVDVGCHLLWSFSLALMVGLVLGDVLHSNVLFIRAKCLSVIPLFGKCFVCLVQRSTTWKLARSERPPGNSGMYTWKYTPALWWSNGD